MPTIKTNLTPEQEEEITWLKKRLATLEGGENIKVGSGGAAELPVQPQPVYETQGAGGGDVPVADVQTQDSMAPVQTQDNTGSFTHSDTLKEYERQLQEQAGNKPGAYSSAYTDQLQAMYDSIINRQGFNYDINADPFYQMYADKYTVNGQRAMQDAQAQAAALTGGYGNSYAQMVGQQTYGEYMRGLTDAALDLENRAYGRYQDEGNDMLTRYQMVMNAENQDYERYQNALDRYWQEKQYAQGLYDDQWAREYGVYTDDRNYETQKEQILYEREQQARDNAYATAMQILQTGQMPSVALLAQAGISTEDAQLLMNAYKPKSSGGSGSGSRKKETDKTQSDVDMVNYWMNNANANLKDIMSQTQWENTRENVDPFYAAQKNATQNNAFAKGSQMQQSDKQYNAYLESALMDAVRSGKMSAKTAAQLANQYAKDEKRQRNK